jgi:microcompartment protein CcmK/EutM
LTKKSQECRYETNEEGRRKNEETTQHRSSGDAACFHSAFFILHSAFLMRLGTVIGRVTLSQAVPALEGGRFLVVSPFTREHFQRGTKEITGMSKDPSLVIYDDLGGGVGQTVGFIEGAEATAPFDQPTPIDAINAALVDEIFYSPFNK